LSITLPIALEPLSVELYQPMEAVAGPGPAEPEARTSEPQEDVSAVQGVYVISVASRILQMHPQTLRKYERLGLVSPSRSGGMLRLYSAHDIGRLRMIKHLVEDRGMNLAGVEMALDTVARLLDLRALLGTVMEANALESALARLDSILLRLHFAVRPRPGAER
jgi:MerR family transcriptional regulator/heat shock protein HspR